MKRLINPFPEGRIKNCLKDGAKIADQTHIILITVTEQKNLVKKYKREILTSFCATQRRTFKSHTRSNKTDRNEKKGFILKDENIDHGLVVLSADLKDKSYEIIVDSGSEKNYIKESIVKQEDFILENIKEFNLVFGNGMKTVINKKMEINFRISDEEYDLKEIFFVVSGPDFDMLLGNEFFLKRRCVLDFSSKILALKIMLSQWNFQRRMQVL